MKISYKLRNLLTKVLTGSLFHEAYDLFIPLQVTGVMTKTILLLVMVKETRLFSVLDQAFVISLDKSYLEKMEG
jgi:hypothetical protein